MHYLLFVHTVLPNCTHDNELVIIVADMRKDVQDIFRATPHSKQVMMFSATLSKEVRPICKRFMQDVIQSPLDFSSCRGKSLSFVKPRRHIPCSILSS